MKQRSIASKTAESKSSSSAARTGRTIVHSQVSSQSHLLQLHRKYGNRAVQRMYESGLLQRQEAEAEATEAEATEARLNENGITIHSSGSCRDRSRTNCTSVDGIRTQTIDGLIAFRDQVALDLTMTGGTETGHTAGPRSHANGYKVDIALNERVNTYIETNFTFVRTRGDGARVYRGGAGNLFAREGNHWDITFP